MRKYRDSSLFKELSEEELMSLSMEEYDAYLDALDEHESQKKERKFKNGYKSLVPLYIYELMKSNPRPEPTGFYTRVSIKKELEEKYGITVGVDAIGRHLGVLAEADLGIVNKGNKGYWYDVREATDIFIYNFTCANSALNKGFSLPVYIDTAIWIMNDCGNVHPSLLRREMDMSLEDTVQLFLKLEVLGVIGYLVKYQNASIIKGLEK